MRGEKLYMAVTPDEYEGSPPHARGKGGGVHGLRAAIRITPACAGKSHRVLYPDRRGRDHPRMRGEKQSFVDFRCLVLGSPPHARGKGKEICALTSPAGITPACAGKRLLEKQNSDDW